MLKDEKLNKIYREKALRKKEIGSKDLMKSIYKLTWGQARVGGGGDFFN